MFTSCVHLCVDFLTVLFMHCTSQPMMRIYQVPQDTFESEEESKEESEESSGDEGEVGER